MIIYNHYAICGLAALGGLLFGFDISSMSGVLATQAYKQYFPSAAGGDGTTQGAITASMPAGSLLGSLLSSFIADRLSRRAAIQVGGTIFIIGALVQSAALNVWTLCAGRSIAGVAIGICSTIVPIYQAEIAPKEIRGRVVSLQQWATTWGILIQYFIQYGAAQLDGGPDDPNQSTRAFRIPWGMQAIPALILVLGLFFLPRSPRWLASKNLLDESLEVLANLRAGGDRNDPNVVAEFELIKETLRFEQAQGTTSLMALTKPRILKRVLLGISIQMWSQLSGMNVMMYYIIFIMESAGTSNPLVTASIQYVINVIMTIPAILFLDKVGRRPVLILGALTMMTCLFITGALLGQYGVAQHKADSNVTRVIPHQHRDVSKAIVAFSYIFVAAFATSWGPVSWTYVAEIFPSKVRAKAVSLSTASNWTWNMALAFTVPPLLKSISWKMYLIFATFNGLAMLHVFFLAPETMGRTLEDMDEVFDAGIPAWRTTSLSGAKQHALRQGTEAGADVSTIGKLK